MTKVTQGGFRIRSIADGTLYRAQVERSDGAEFHVDGKITKIWETMQSTDAEGAVGQALYAINTGRIK